MIGQSFPEDLDCGNFFDNMDDLIDFPGGDIDVGFGLDDSDSFPNIWTTHHDTWPAPSDPLFSSNTTNNSDSSPELYVPFEDIVKVDRPLSFVEESILVEKKDDSFSTNTDSSSSHNSQFRSSSPVSVLESSSSSSQTTNNTTSLVLPGKHGRPRTKRPRPTVQDKDRVCGADSRLIIRIPKQFLSDHNNKMMITKTKKIKKKAKVTSSSSSSGIDLEVNVDSYSSEQNPVRKCMHCEVTKTPQWRLGPMGPKTLCNACGVRYKSGRLFPEYRPAASPTFTPALHSNSHKKVAEMRNKRCSAIEENDQQELIPNNAYIGVD